MSALGHSRPIRSAPVPNNVRYASNSDHSGHESELTLRWPEADMRFARVEYGREIGISLFPGRAFPLSNHLAKVFFGYPMLSHSVFDGLLDHCGVACPF
jgi:hypothetical protein